MAREIYERIRAANPDLIPARLKLAVIYESQGRLEEAQLLVQEILRISSDLTADRMVQAPAEAGYFGAKQQVQVRDRLRRAGVP